MHESTVPSSRVYTGNQNTLPSSYDGSLKGVNYGYQGYQVGATVISSQSTLASGPQKQQQGRPITASERVQLHLRKAERKAEKFAKRVETQKAKD